MIFLVCKTRQYKLYKIHQKLKHKIKTYYISTGAQHMHTNTKVSPYNRILAFAISLLFNFLNFVGA
jgi:hypothetical protein